MVETVHGLNMKVAAHAGRRPATAEKARVIGPLLKKNLHDAYAAG